MMKQSDIDTVVKALMEAETEVLKSTNKQREVAQQHWSDPIVKSSEVNKLFDEILRKLKGDN